LKSVEGQCLEKYKSVISALKKKSGWANANSVFEKILHKGEKMAKASEVKPKIAGRKLMSVESNMLWLKLRDSYTKSLEKMKLKYTNYYHKYLKKPSKYNNKELLARRKAYLGLKKLWENQGKKAYDSKRIKEVSTKIVDLTKGAKKKLL
jgi:hypothetical protein